LKCALNVPLSLLNNETQNAFFKVLIINEEVLRDFYNLFNEENTFQVVQISGDEKNFGSRRLDGVGREGVL
jgi:hypothetical protein